MIFSRDDSCKKCLFLQKKNFSCRETRFSRGPLQEAAGNCRRVSGLKNREGQRTPTARNEAISLWQDFRCGGTSDLFSHSAQYRCHTCYVSHFIPSANSQTGHLLLESGRQHPTHDLRFFFALLEIYFDFQRLL